MLSKLYFDNPVSITPAVHLAVECLGGLKLDDPEHNTVRDQFGFALKAPRALTTADILDINHKLAAHFGVAPREPADPQDFGLVARATEETARAIAALSGNEWQEVGCIDDFSPDADHDSLLYGILHWCFDGNNLSGAAY